MSNQDKTIIRVAKNRENPYVMINKGFLEYESLSFKAKGILSYLLSRPDNWEIMITHLVKVSKDKESSVRAGLDELMKYGYVEKITHRDSKGRFTNFEYIIYETQQDFLIEEAKNKQKKSKKSKKKSAETTGNSESYPVAEKPKVEKPKVDYPQVENQALIINDFNNKDFNNNDLNNNNEEIQEESVVVLKKDIDKILETPIPYSSLVALLSKKDESTVRFYLDNWSKFKGSKNNVIGFFIDMVTKEYELPKEIKGQNNYKPPQSTNFEQRKYDDEYFESLYENIK